MMWRVLLVEDEPLVRSILAEELADAGFVVCDAGDGDRAAELIEDDATDFDLLMTSLYLPGQVNGVQLAQLMRAHNPAAYVVFTTGQPDFLGLTSGLGSREALVPKPFAPSDILRAIRALFARD
jgi:DNA-binding response OmpR family regulator